MSEQELAAKLRHAIEAAGWNVIGGVRVGHGAPKILVRARHREPVRIGIAHAIGATLEEAYRNLAQKLGVKTEEEKS